MKYHVGDIVRVKENLEIDQAYGEYYFVREMNLPVVTIEKVFSNLYSIAEGPFLYSKEMLGKLVLNSKDCKIVKAILLLHKKKWIARDKSGELYIYKNKPLLGDSEDSEYPCMFVNNSKYNEDYPREKFNPIELNQELLPFVTFENSPINLKKLLKGEYHEL